MRREVDEALRQIVDLEMLVDEAVEKRQLSLDGSFPLNETAQNLLRNDFGFYLEDHGEGVTTNWHVSWKG